MWDVRLTHLLKGLLLLQSRDLYDERARVEGKTVQAATTKMQITDAIFMLLNVLQRSMC